MRWDKKQAFDYDDNGNLLYQGQANPACLKDQPSWNIKKFIYNDNNKVIEVLFADGDTKETKIWDNRASLTYL